jgi:beta-lactamase class A
VIAGTILSVWDPASRFTAGAQAEKTEQPAASATPQPTVPSLTLSQEIGGLKTQLQAAIAPQPQFTTGLMVVDIDSQNYIDINASTEFPAASTIKFPVLVAFFQDVDAGKIRLDEMLTMRKELIATESGYMQYQPVGTQFPALEVATKMITESDNTATNMVIDRLGGNEALNQRFQSWGLAQTTLHNPLPDLPGTNTSSPRDMVTLFNSINSGKMMSVRALERMLDIMRQVRNNSLLPQGLGQGATIAHKTGDIGTMLGDVGMVDMPNGKRYLIAAMVKRPHNDDRAYDLINQMSKLTYQYLSQGAAPEANPTNAAPANPQGADPQQRSTIARP